MRLSILSVVLAAASTVACESSVGVVRGTVTDGTKPVADANVVLDCGGRGHPATTDSRGKYTTERQGFLSPGCEVEASKEGFASSRQKLGNKCTDNDKLNCRTAVVDFQLAPTK
jgi:hypothetical protein